MGDLFATTVVGSMPKPAWLYEHAQINVPGSDHHGRGANWALAGTQLEMAQDDAVRLAIHDQEKAGVDIISDGEQRRKSYLTYVTARLAGIDYENLAQKWIRDGRRLAEVGRCIGPVQRTGPILIDSLKFLMAETRSPVKITLPGPMTVADSIFDDFYHNEPAFVFAVADALNEEARALDALGPAVIQFDEPVFSRYPEKVTDWGIEALNRSVAGITAKTAVHVCYSYPIAGLDRPIKPSYPTILKELNNSNVDQLALEFEAPQLDLALLRLCPDKTVLLGCIDNGSESVESPEQIASRLVSAAKHHPPEMLQAAPDCGLVTLSGAAARAKLVSMVQGARLARKRL